MYLGEGTPVESLFVGTPPVQGRAGLVAVQPRKSPPDNSDNKAAVDSTDHVDLSGDARAILQSSRSEDPAPAEQPQEGPVHRQVEQIQARIEQVSAQIETLKTNPEKPQLQDIGQVAEELYNIGQQLGLIQPAGNDAVSSYDTRANVINDFRAPAKGFTEFVREFQASFDDENRFPPRLSTVIDGLIRAALEEAPGAAAPALDKLA